MLMDNYCRLLGSYDFGTKDCDSKPFVLQASFLQYELIIKLADRDVVRPYFDFRLCE